eukprot:COSAG06_NODE_507_length_14929_cov_109.047067_2_plen_139_part_00
MLLTPTDEWPHCMWVPAQAYTSAVCSCPPHPNVCRLIGWRIEGKGPTLKGLVDGDKVYMVQEYAGEELQKLIDGGATVAPDVALNYLKQLATGVSICVSKALFSLSACQSWLLPCVTLRTMLCVFRLGTSTPEKNLSP